METELQTKYTKYVADKDKMSELARKSDGGRSTNLCKQELAIFNQTSPKWIIKKKVKRG